MSRDKVVVVTGANRGLGLEIARQVAAHPEPITLLAGSRSGQDLKLSTAHPSSKVLYPKLDITNDADIVKLVSVVQDLGGIDVLINNAGLSFETFGIEDKKEVMSKTLSLNYYGTAALIDAMIPLMHEGGRIVSLSSSASQDCKFDNDELHKRVTDPNLTRQQLDDLVKEYSVAGVDPQPGSGWSTSPYGPMYSTVKAFINILSRLVARDHPELLVNSICPGASYTTPRVQDQMPIKFKTAEQGASEAVRLALGDIQGVTGKYWAGDTLDSLHAHVIDDWMGREIKATPRELTDSPFNAT
ncbi:hypothetical protein BCR39DRAFT_286564 [Naematelia encephala]|uniref:NAD(P)-binding protein n=1 Tax=Naematelia encephala TaxID=71784 RepID=A0A1Y2ASU8_9TREE|nr:hypothetical protein BCR39DRAFT_286564 [Naematelia encephala]